jgi:5-methylcytosine-specific restriction endonuclease McrA
MREVRPDIACINCDGPIAAPKRPYLFCSERCRDTADYVRYHRRVLADGRIRREDVAEAVRIKKAFVLGGGYPAKDRALPGDQRAAIFARDQGPCYKCGGPGNEIDHTFEHRDRDLNDSSNLRVICSECHRRKTIETALRPISEIEDPEVRKRLEAFSEELDRRVHAKKPLLSCDCEKNWADRWRKIGEERITGKLFAGPNTGPFVVSYDPKERNWIVLQVQEGTIFDDGTLVDEYLSDCYLDPCRTWEEAMEVATLLFDGLCEDPLSAFLAGSPARSETYDGCSSTSPG